MCPPNGAMPEARAAAPPDSISTATRAAARPMRAGCVLMNDLPTRVSLVEADLDAIPVLHHVVPALEPRPGLLARPRLIAGLEQPIPRHHLGANEALREIGVDLARGVHRALAAPQRPGPHLVGSDGEERDQTQQLVARADDQREPVLGHAQLGAEPVALAGRERDDLALEVGAQRH